MRCKQWIFDMDGTLTDSMTVVWRGAPLALLQRYGRTPKADLNDVLPVSYTHLDVYKRQA